MKKILVVLLTLALFGGFAVAQDKPTVVSSMSAYLDGGLQITLPNSGDPTIVFYGNETPVAGGRMNFNYSFAYGDFGAKIRFRANPYVNGTFANNAKNGTGSSYADIFVRRAWAYYNFFDKMLQVNFGIFGIGDFGTSWIGNVAFDNPNTGMVVEVKPMAGLTLGYGLPFTADSTTVADAFKGSTIAVKYSMEKLFDLNAWVANVGVTNGMSVVADVNVTAVENLTASVEVYYNAGAGGFSGPTKGIYALENFSYKIGALEPGANLDQTMPDGGTTVITVNPYVSYDLGNDMSAGADFGYSTASGNPITADVWGKAVFGKNYLKAIGAYNTSTKVATLTVAAVTSF